MALFDEVQFPTNIAFTSTGGPQRQTQIVVMNSGAEARNARWINSRRQWDVMYGKLSLDDQFGIIEFWEARNGRLIGFRFRDPMDYMSCLIGNYNKMGTPAPTDQAIGIGDGVTQNFRLVKTYTSGSRSWVRNIFKPVAGTVLVALNGVKQTSGWSVDNTTGVVSFAVAPTYGTLIQAGYVFDTPVRFDTDKIDHNQTDPGAASIQSLPIIELPEAELLS